MLVTLVKDVMTTDVVTAGGATPYKEIVRLLADHHVSALPVIGPDRTLLGVVSEADLLLKEELPHALSEAPLLERRERRVARTKASASAAAELMTSQPVTARPEDTVREAARRMHARRVKRLPVVDAQGRLVGIVSRADLLKVYLRADEEIARQLREDLLLQELVRDVPHLGVEVRDGVVTLTGRVERRSELALLAGLAESVDGVVRVDQRMDYEVDDVSVALRTPYPYIY